MNLNTTMLIVGIIVLVAVFELLRRRTLREKYAAVWLITGFITVIAALFPEFVEKISRSLGFTVPSNFVLLGAGVVLLFVTMQMSLELGKVESQVQTLTEEVALLRLEIDKNK